MEITVGQVSGIITVGVLVVRFLFPNLLIFLFLGTLPEHGNTARANAVSWSSNGRFLHSSPWPTILSSDTAAFTGASTSIVAFRCVGLAGALLISIAAIVRPLGLYEAVVADHRPAFPLFPVTCPDLTRPDPHSEDTADNSMPEETMSIFDSGLSAASNTISSITDIQWRSWTWLKYEHADAPREPFPAGVTQQIGVLALNDGYDLVEGLVVDTKDGGIGLRNHSAPPLTLYGSTWSEDLLFVQPVTVCVDTNLTIEYTVPQEYFIGGKNAVSQITLVDRGGFVNLNQTVPEWDCSMAQMRPEDLRMRAHQAAYFNNVYAMKILNVSDTIVTGNISDPLHIKGMNSTLGQRFLIGDESECYGLRNPSLVFGVARPLDDTEGANYGKDGTIVLPGSTWSKPIYSCTTAAEARIKTVTFAFNITDNLSGLTVKGIMNKQYATEDDKPLWGVENFPDLRASSLPPLWGLVSSDARNRVLHPNELQTVRKEALLLPVSGGTHFSSSKDNMPGADFYPTAMGMFRTLTPLSESHVADYTGATNIAMAQRWSNLSQSAQTMGNVLNLIWTDAAANLVVGTKGCAPDPENAFTRAVTVYRLRVRYELPYAVPAVIVLALLALVAALNLLAVPVGRTSLAKMSRYLNATSAGRIMVATLRSSEQLVDNDRPSAEWIQREAKADILVGRNRPLLVSSGAWEPNDALQGGDEAGERKPCNVTTSMLDS
ncbi:hypothetical protein BJY04DRAFT_212127 [Aspergillus karnatakaensis]|uniref:uncharacterized protein n=1 Tax=Aspergillus karnatakaensis TaxID=1810916 RepID=UPI003CCDBC10